MNERDSSDESSIRNIQRVQQPDTSLDKSNTELLHEIDDMLKAPNAEFDLDGDKLKRYLEILQERAPVAEEYVPGEVWSELKKKLSHRSMTTDGKMFPGRGNRTDNSSARPRAVSRIAVAAVCAMLFFAMTVTAFGFNPIKALFNWAEDVVQLWGNPSGVMELQDAAPGEYRSLEEALEADGMSTNSCPTWVPKDYMITGVNAQIAGNIKKYSAVYEGARGELLIRIVELETSDWYTSEEKNEGGYAYQHNGIEYYIVSNSDQSKAGWQVGKYAYLINGQVSEEELKTMINSIS